MFTDKIFDMQTNKELIIETLKEQGWKKFYLGSPFEDGLEEDYSDVAEKILFMLQQFGTEIKPPLQQEAVSGSALLCNDFKMGNIFFDKRMKSIFTIYTFNRHGVRTRYPWGGSIFLELKFIEPVLITGELLLKLGFENEVLDSQEGTLGFTKKYKPKYAEYFSDLDINNISGMYFIDEFDFNFKYVHELQNFYYCLTGVMLSLS
jgi:hypothetical protein